MEHVTQRGCEVFIPEDLQNAARQGPGQSDITLKLSCLELANLQTIFNKIPFGEILAIPEIIVPTRIWKVFHVTASFSDLGDVCVFQALEFLRLLSALLKKSSMKFCSPCG